MMCCVDWDSQTYLPSLWQCGISVVLPKVNGAEHLSGT